MALNGYAHILTACPKAVTRNVQPAIHTRQLVSAKADVGCQINPQVGGCSTSRRRLGWNLGAMPRLGAKGHQAV